MATENVEIRVVQLEDRVKTLENKDIDSEKKAEVKRQNWVRALFLLLTAALTWLVDHFTKGGK